MTHSYCVHHKVFKKVNRCIIKRTDEKITTKNFYISLFNISNGFFMQQYPSILKSETTRAVTHINNPYGFQLLVQVLQIYHPTAHKTTHPPTITPTPHPSLSTLPKKYIALTETGIGWVHSDKLFLAHWMFCNSHHTFWTIHALHPNLQ